MRLVQTSGNFMLLDVLGGQDIEDNKVYDLDGEAEEHPHLRETDFVERALEDGRLVHVGGTVKAPEASEGPTSGRGRKKAVDASA